MDFGIVKEVLSVAITFLMAWGIMRERILRAEIRIENLEKENRVSKSSHEEFEDKVYMKLEQIANQQQEMLLRMERNNVR